MSAPIGDVRLQLAQLMAVRLETDQIRHALRKTTFKRISVAASFSLQCAYDRGDLQREVSAPFSYRLVVHLACTKHLQSIGQYFDRFARAAELVVKRFTHRRLPRAQLR